MMILNGALTQSSLETITEIAGLLIVILLAVITVLGVCVCCTKRQVRLQYTLLLVLNFKANSLYNVCLQTNDIIM